MQLILQNHSLEYTIFRLIMIAITIATTTKFSCVSLSSKFLSLAPTALPVLTQLCPWLLSHFSLSCSLCVFSFYFPFSSSQAFPSSCFVYFSLSEIVFPNLCQLEILSIFLGSSNIPSFLYFLLRFLNKPSPSYELKFEFFFFCRNKASYQEFGSDVVISSA